MLEKKTKDNYVEAIYDNIMDGWHNKLLRVDLSEQKYSVEPLHERIINEFIGGKGLGIFYLFHELNVSADPLDPSNMLILATGPIQGVGYQAYGRHCWVTRSPLSGIWLDTHVGGFFGTELKKAGYDAVIFTGKAKELTYITIIDDEVLFHSCPELSGTTTLKMERILREKHGSKIKVSSIGPAGEKNIPFACVNSDGFRTAGRGGLGSVFGSKNLKAVGILGAQTVKVANPEKLKLINRSLTKIVSETRKEGYPFMSQGTAFLVEVANDRNQLPTRNYQTGSFESYHLISGDKIEEEYTTQRKPCYKCAISCGYVIKERFNWLEHETDPIAVPEYETLGLLGSNCGITDIETIVHANYLANTYGVDTITLGSTISLWMELTERGLIPEKYQKEGIRFGESKKLIDLIHKIINQEGIGKILSKGVKEAAEELGEEAIRYAVHVKGLGIPAWDPRGKLGAGVSYATSDVGGSHLRGFPVTNEIPDQSAVEVMDSLIEEQNLKIIKDSLISCHFHWHFNSQAEDYAKMLEAVIGRTVTADELKNMANRTWLLIRMFNIRLGLRRKDDILPPRFMLDPSPPESDKGVTAFISDDDFKASIDRYYSLRGCNPEDGIPLEERADNLNLKEEFEIMKNNI
ncbi:MAG: aldehyde ferredoxin oxidoreductase family protein [Candidatus Kariarchaeaceae archaeon]